MKHRKQKAFPASWTRSQVSLGFTLVELIVVVTILAILATIGFVSYSSYLTGVRDTNRLAQLVSIHDGLELYRTRNDLPLPDDNVEVRANGTTIAYQGYAGSNTLETIDFTKGGKDPRDKSYFSYYLTEDRKYFQLMAFLEEEANITSSLRPSGTSLYEGGYVSPAFAVDYTDRITTTYGKKLGILTDTSNTPIQEISAITTAGLVDFDGTGLEYVAHLDDANTLTSSGAILLQGTLSHTVGRSQRNCKSILSANSLTQGIDGEYWINIGGESLKVYCDMTTDGGGWTLVIQGHDDDIIKYDIRGNDSWDTNNTISYGGLDNTFKFSDDILNHIRSGGMYMTHGNSDIATEARFYMDSTCNYNHTLGLNGTCGGPNTLYDDVALTSARTCVGNLSYKGIGCWGPVIMNYTGAGKDNAFCYTNGGGWCAANTTVENIVLRLYVR